jgi:hypothetical protein
MTFTETVQLTTINCGSCGGTYAINERYRLQRQEQGGYWHCPYCECSWGYSVSENTKLKKQMEDKERELRAAKCEVLNAQAETYTERAAKELVQRKLKRVNRGVCHCCQRSFQNLQRHMATKHPKELAK